MILYGDLTPSDSDVADMSSWWLNLNCRLPADDRSGASRAMIVDQCSAREKNSAQRLQRRAVLYRSFFSRPLLKTMICAVAKKPRKPCFQADSADGL